MIISFIFLFLSARCNDISIGIFESWGTKGREFYSKNSGLIAENISQVLSTSDTVGVRIALDPNEAQRTLEKIDLKFNIPVSNEEVLSSLTPLAKYVFWGLNSEAPQQVYTLLGILPENGLVVNGVCSVGNSLIALKNGSMACWGDNVICTDINGFMEKHNTVYVNKIFCPRFGSAVLMNVTLNKGPQLMPLGDPAKGGSIPSKDIRTKLGKAVSISSFAGNPYALAVVTNTGTVLAWGDPARGGKYLLNASIRGLAVHSTNTSFTVVTKENKVYTWGTITEEDIPLRIRINGSLNVKKIVTGRDCYAAILEDLTVAVWGGKSAPYCREDAEDVSFIPYSSVKKELKNVLLVVINHGAIAVTTKSRIVIAWGKESHGGFPLSTKDFNLAFPYSLVGTCCAFAFIKKGLRIVAWGDPDYGGSLQSEISSISSLAKLSASERFMATIMGKKTIILWGGPYKHKIAVISEKKSPFYDSYNYAFFFTTRNSIIAIRSRNCLTVETTAGNACSKPCGGGIRELTYKVFQKNANNLCSSLLKSRYTSCNTHPCIENSRIKTVHFTYTEYIVGGVCVTFLLSFLIWAVINCIRSQRPNATDFKFSS